MNRSRPDRFRVPPWRRARRPAGGHPPDAPGARPGDGGRGGRRARGVGAHRPARPRGARHGRRAGLLPPGPQRRLAAGRRRPHRSQRAQRRRGPGPVPRGRAVVGGHARGEGGAAQAGAGAARAVPRRGRGGVDAPWSSIRRAGTSRPAPGRRRRTSTPCSRRSWRASRSPSATSPATGPPAPGSCTRSGSPRKGSVVVPRRRHRRRPAHVPRRPHHRRSSPPASPSCGPTGFDLAEAWRLITDEVDQRRTPVRGPGDGGGGEVVADPAPGLRHPPAHRAAGRWPIASRSSCGATASSRWPGEIAGFGAAVEVLDPPAVRQRLAAAGGRAALALRRRRHADRGRPACIWGPVRASFRRGGRPCPPGRPAHRRGRTPRDCTSRCWARFVVRIDGRDVTEALVGRSRSVFQYLAPRRRAGAARRPDRRVLARVRRRAGPQQPQRRHHRHPPGARLPGHRPPPLRRLPHRPRHRDVDRRRARSPSCCRPPTASTATTPTAPSPSTAGRWPSTGASCCPRPATATGSSPGGGSCVHAHLDAVKRLAALCRDEGNLFEAAWAAQLGLLVDDLDEELVESWLQTLADRRANRPPRRRPAHVLRPAGGGAGRAAVGPPAGPRRRAPARQLSPPTSGAHPVTGAR